MGKYRLWRWKWGELGRLLASLRKEHFAVGVSVRRGDARDHLLLRLAGVTQRVGFPHPRGARLLTRPLPTPAQPRHIVEDWRAISAALELEARAEPALAAENYRDAETRKWTARTGRPLLCLHTGARIAVRRWPETHFRALLERMRARFDFDLLLIPDPDGYGLGLAPLADRVVERLTLPQLVGVLGSVDGLLCNDSAPGHLAAALGVPVCTVFGPTGPERYRPWGEKVQVVIRDICPERPCFDHCKFAEPVCLTRLSAETIWPEVENFFAAHLPNPAPLP